MRRAGPGPSLAGSGWHGSLHFRSAEHRDCGLGRAFQPPDSFTVHGRRSSVVTQIALPLCPSPVTVRRRGSAGGPLRCSFVLRAPTDSCCRGRHAHGPPDKGPAFHLQPLSPSESVRQQITHPVGMSCPSWQWHRTGSRWFPVRTLPVAPLWCDLGFVLNSRGNKAAENLRPRVTVTIKTNRAAARWPVGLVFTK